MVHPQIKILSQWNFVYMPKIKTLRLITTQIYELSTTCLSFSHFVKRTMTWYKIKKNNFDKVLLITNIIIKLYLLARFRIWPIAKWF